jgi:hypothetical protein
MDMDASNGTGGIDPRDADSYTWAVLWEAASRGDEEARAKLDALAQRVLWAEER